MKKKKNYKVSPTLIAIITLAIVTLASGKTIYVDDDAAGANNGTSWVDAYVYLQDALVDAKTADKPVEIRVAQGTYKPDQGIRQTPGDREATFQLINGVTLKGGFAGVNGNDPNACDIELYETILSGDLLDNDDDPYDPEDPSYWENVLKNQHLEENIFHVVTASGTDNSAVIDGFIVTRGIDYRVDFEFIGTLIIETNIGHGAGLYNREGSPTVNNCSFRDNRANAGGSGMYNKNGNPILTNCTFSGNSSGGMYNDNSDPNLTGCVFIGNSAAKGGGIYNLNSNPRVSNCKFIENRASMGGGMYNSGSGSFSVSGAIVKQCSFISNYATSQQQYIEGGGAIFNEACHLNISNCLFTGNQASKGGGLYCRNKCLAWISNCTFDGNYARGNAISTGDNLSQPSNINIINCIMWDSDNNINNFDNSDIVITYSNIRGSRWGLNAENIIDEDPLFADPGYWADVDDPNIVIEPDDPNAVWVNGDYHLKSEHGRWNPNTQTWVTDDVTSPCIDAGDPNTPVGDEPFPNGVLINMGAYGGTAEASKSFSEIPEVVNVNDSDNGGQVTLIQGQILAVTLESNPTTGYSWAPVEKQNSILDQFGDSLYLPSEQEDGTVGAGGWEIFYFRSISAGQETLELIYRRPWETDVEPAKTFSIEVTVN